MANKLESKVKEIEVGDMINLNCKICNKVTSQRYDGMTINMTKEYLTSLDYTEKEAEKIINQKQCTCQICHGSFAYDIKVINKAYNIK